MDTPALGQQRHHGERASDSAVSPGPKKGTGPPTWAAYCASRSASATHMAVALPSETSVNLLKRLQAVAAPLPGPPLPALPPAAAAGPPPLLLVPPPPPLAPPPAAHTRLEPSPALPELPAAGPPAASPAPETPVLPPLASGAAAASPPATSGVMPSRGRRSSWKVAGWPTAGTATLCTWTRRSSRAAICRSGTPGSEWEARCMHASNAPRVHRPGQIMQCIQT